MLTLEKINELTQGIEYHLRKLESFESGLREVKAALEELRHAKESEYLWELQKYRADIEDIRHQLRKRGLPDAEKYEIQFRKIKDSLNEHQWPVAVNPEAICNDDERATIRAESILDLVVGEHLQGRKFLDYGCGQGHVVQAAISRGAMAIGYDINAQGEATNNFEDVKKHAPFDIILMHDVLDHIQSLNPMEALAQAKSVLAPEGRIYVRNHPWSSKHGGHLYEHINKAYLHLILDEVELTRLGGFACEYNIRVVRPLETYRHWFDSVGLSVKSEIPINSNVDEYFKKPSFVHERLLHNWEGDEAAMLFNMGIDFVEYIVESDGISNQQIF